MKARHDYLPSRRGAFFLVLGAGAVTFVIGMVEDHDWASDARIAGAVLLVGGLIRWAVRPAFIAQRDLYAAGYQQGYDQGYNEGRRVDRPRLVRLDELRRQDPGHEASPGGPAA